MCENYHPNFTMTDICPCSDGQNLFLLVTSRAHLPKQADNPHGNNISMGQFDWSNRGE